jgi:uncharacterized protein YoxC
MVIEIVVGAIGIAFILLVIFFIITLQRLRRVIRKTDRTLTEICYLLHSISAPSIEMVDGVNKLIGDVQKKLEGLDVLFHPLYGLKKEKSEGHTTSEKIYGVLEYITEGVHLFNKIKKEMK